MRTIQCNKRTIYTLIGLLVLLLPILWPPQSVADEPTKSTQSQPSQAAILRLGERMYREGILPSGKPMEAVVKGDIPVQGTTFTCVSCHLRSGIGSEEGGVATPPTNGKNLYRPVTTLHKYYQVASAPPVRPAYTDKSLAEALLTGVDPAGRKMNDTMPRYMLDDKDMAILIAYLKSLSSDFSPGVTDTTIRFATVVTDDVSQKDRDAMLAPLDKYFAYKNNQAKFYESKTGRRSARMAESMLLSREVIYKRLVLSRWLLKGPPETWRGQLEEYYRKEPVFALLSGITKGQWRPIHEFCEDHHIPSILPITDFPVISANGWYTVYFSKGFYQEGEAAARYLNSIAEELKDRHAVEIVRDSPEGRALSSGFRETWQTLGHSPVQSTMIKEGEELTKEFLERMMTRERPAVLLVWDGPGALPGLEGLAASAKRPDRVFVSSSFLGKSIWTIREGARDLIYLTYPFRLPKDEVPYTNVVESFLGLHGYQGEELVILKEVYSAVQVLSQALIGLKGNYYRDYLLDLFGMTMSSGGMSNMQAGVVLWEREEIYPLYQRFSFGPGQRYASKGCYIVQLAKGRTPELVKKSDWVIH